MLSPKNLARKGLITLYLFDIWVLPKPVMTTFIEHSGFLCYLPRGPISSLR